MEMLKIVKMAFFSFYGGGDPPLSFANNKQLHTNMGFNKHKLPNNYTWIPINLYLIIIFLHFCQQQSCSTKASNL